MNQPQRLDVESIVEMNADLCAETGEISVLLDAEGLDAAVARPWSGFGDHEAFPTLYDKAAALLHGIAARQVFENGNKRTAWVAAVTFLELNGIDIGKVETVQSDMFVRAAALDHTLDIADIAEWFEVAHASRRVGYATDPRVEYLTLALGAEHNQGTADVFGLHLHTMQAELPAPAQVCVVFRIHWRPEDVGRRHSVSFTLEQSSRVAVPRPGLQPWTVLLDAPAVGGHEHHHQGIMPTIVTQHLSMALVSEGSSTLIVTLDDAELGRIPFTVVGPVGTPDFPMTSL